MKQYHITSLQGDKLEKAGVATREVIDTMMEERCYLEYRHTLDMFLSPLTKVLSFIRSEDRSTSSWPSKPPRFLVKLERPSGLDYEFTILGHGKVLGILVTSNVNARCIDVASFGIMNHGGTAEFGR